MAFDISDILHQCRSARLRQINLAPDATLLSAGCSGKWYFDWIAKMTGHFGRHIGVEFYSPKPDDLPENVEWISNTVGDMNAIGDGECDMVFSGENLELLWPEEVAGFFLESSRVLKTGGSLIVDSPNRLLTEPHNWSHPEHTVEATPAEARHLAELAGFKVTSLKGLWLTRDPRSGRLLPLEPQDVDAEWTMTERIACAENEADNSFLWWLEAIKIKPPDRQEVMRTAHRIFNENWPERSRRFKTIIGEHLLKDGRKNLVARKGKNGALVYGPFMPLKAGKHSMVFDLSATCHDVMGEVIARCEVVGSNDRIVTMRDLTQADILESGGLVRLDFDLPELEFGMQARC